MYRQEQHDELLALQAIFDGDECIEVSFRESELEGDEPVNVAIDIALDFDSTKFLRAPELGTALEVRALPLRLQLTLHGGYLCECSEPEPPAVELEACWLQSELRQQLCEALVQQWRLAPNEPVLFTWLEWLRGAAWREFDFVDMDVPQAQLDALAEWNKARLRITRGDIHGVVCENCQSELQGLMLSTCKHNFCLSCLRVAVDLYQSASVPACCPLPSCRSRLDEEIVKRVLDIQPLPKNSVAHILGTPLEGAAVYCPKCEDLGVDSPVLTRGSHDELAFGVLEACTCSACSWTFCGVCRSPFHTQDCCADVSRADRLLRRRPPLPLGSASQRALAATSKKAAALGKGALSRIATQARAFASAQKARSMAKLLQRVQCNSDSDEAKEKGPEEGAQKEAELLARLRCHCISNEVMFTDMCESSLDTFETIRWGIWGENSSLLLSSLLKFLKTVTLRPAPMSLDVCKEFIGQMMQHPKGMLRPAFHGSRACNYASIFQRGLMIPGLGNELRIVNGAAHGQGVYTANADAAWLSAGFCDSPRILICAVWDAGFVRHVGDAMVVQQPGHVIPLFEAFAEHHAVVAPAARRPVVLPPATVAATPPAVRRPVVLQPVTVAPGKLSGRKDKVSTKKHFLERYGAKAQKFKR